MRAGPLEDPWKKAPADMYVLSADLVNLACRLQPEYVEIYFEGGSAISLNGVLMVSR